MKKNTYKRTKCNTCGAMFMSPLSSGAINCPACSKNKGSARERPYTRDTVFLVCKWYDEGMTIKRLASLLYRSEDNIRNALKRGGRLKDE